MRGGFLHNEAMARSLKAALERLGARVWTEYPVGPGRRAGAVDLYAERNGFRLACELEIGPRRVKQDVAKAEILGVDLLLIVTPTATIARVIERRLRMLSRPEVEVRVLPLGRAVQYLSIGPLAECGQGHEVLNPWGRGTGRGRRP